MQREMCMPKGLSFHERVVELALTEDEFVERILAVAKLRFTLALAPKQVVEALDAIHESAHVSLDQRDRNPEAAANDLGDMQCDQEREDAFGDSGVA
jgi:hypothetical protein